MSDRLFTHILYAVLIMLCILSDDVMRKLDVITLFLYMRLTLNDGDK